MPIFAGWGPINEKEGFDSPRERQPLSNIQLRQ